MVLGWHGIAWAIVGGKDYCLGLAKKFLSNQRVNSDSVPVWFLWIILGVDDLTVPG
jgi:hypothetical protein